MKNIFILILLLVSLSKGAVIDSEGGQEIEDNTKNDINKSTNLDLTKISLKKMYFPNFLFVEFKENFNQSNFSFIEDKIVIQFEDSRLIKLPYQDSDTNTESNLTLNFSKNFKECTFNFNGTSQENVTVLKFLYSSTQDHLSRCSMVYTPLFLLMGFVMATTGEEGKLFSVMFYIFFIIFGAAEGVFELIKNRYINLSFNAFITLGASIISAFISTLIHKVDCITNFIFGFLFGNVVLKLMFYFVLNFFLVPKGIEFNIFCFLFAVVSILSGIVFVYMTKLKLLKKLSFIFTGSYFVLYGISLCVGGFYYDRLAYMMKDINWLKHSNWAIYLIVYIFIAFFIFCYEFIKAYIRGESFIPKEIQSERESKGKSMDDTIKEEENEDEGTTMNQNQEGEEDLFDDSSNKRKNNSINEDSLGNSGILSGRRSDKYDM